MDITNVTTRSASALASSGTNRSDSPAGGRILPANGQKAPASPAAAPTPQQVEQAVKQLQSYLSDNQRQLQFQVDSASGRTIVRVVNPETNELIRQIPSEEMLTLARAIQTSGGTVISQLV